MQLRIFSTHTSRPVTVTLSDERRALANALSILDRETVTGLDIDDCPDERLPKNLSAFPNLASLKLTRCHAISGVSQELTSCPALRDLALIQCADFCDVSGIARCPALRAFHACGCDGLQAFSPDAPLPNALLALDLSHTPSLEWIALEKLPPSLRILDVHGCPNLNFEDSAVLRLHLVSTQIQDLSRPEVLEQAAPVGPDHLRRAMMRGDSAGLDDG